MIPKVKALLVVSICVLMSVMAFYITMSHEGQVGIIQPHSGIVENSIKIASKLGQEVTMDPKKDTVNTYRLADSLQFKLPGISGRATPTADSISNVLSLSSTDPQVQRDQAAVKVVAFLKTADQLSLGDSPGKKQTERHNETLSAVSQVSVRQLNDAERKEHLSTALDTSTDVSNYSVSHTARYSQSNIVTRVTNLPDIHTQPGTLNLHGNTTCVRPYCLEYLTPSDRMYMNDCLKRVERFHTTPRAGKCHFMEGSKRQPVALVSYPGSGNTWIRGLLETATGICTGAIYCDMSLRADGMVGEYVQSGAVLVVKTHGSVARWLQGTQIKANGGRTYFGSAIFIIRNPLDAFVAEWNRKVANNFKGRTVTLRSHVKSAGKQWFGENQKWKSFVYIETKRWQTMIKNWIIQSAKHRVLVVKFENVKLDTASEVKRMLKFLHIPYNDSQLEQKLMQGYRVYHRSHHGEDFEHYTPELKKYVSKGISNIVDLLKRQHAGAASLILTVQEYLEVKH